MTERQMLRVIGQNVQAARRGANLTQECLAELIGVHWHTISNVENGNNPFSVLVLHRLAQTLGVSSDQLLRGLPEPDWSRIEKIKKMMARKRKPKRE